MLQNNKPQGLAVTKPQGASTKRYDSNSTSTLKDSKSRYERGMELYKEGKVSIGSNGYFKVSGFQVDTERMQCECLDFKTRKQTCKHIYSALLFVKNRGKQTIEHLNDGELTSLHDVTKLTEGNGGDRKSSAQNAHLKESARQNVGQLTSRQNGGKSAAYQNDTQHKPTDPVPLMAQGNSKPFDRQSTITRLAVLNTATEILKTHRTPLEPETVIAIAAQLEAWALGGGK